MSLSLKNVIAAPLLLAAAFYVGVVIGQEGVEFEGWGLLFLSVALALVFGFIVSWWLAHNNYNVSAIVLTALSAAGLALGLALLAPEIGWGKSLWLCLLLVGGIVATLILAARRR